MEQGDAFFAPADLPDDLPVFPLNGVLLLPGGQLPLNIFEPRYLAMIDSALRGNRMIGMIQPKKVAPEEKAGTGDLARGDPARDDFSRDDPVLYDIGCAGRIVSFEETEDGRYLVTLKGVSRFRVVKELPLAPHPFRRVKSGWGAFADDLRPPGCLDLDRDRLCRLLKIYFEKEGLSCGWDLVHDAPDERLITCLAMVCPFSALEKQALLEAGCCQERARIFLDMLEMAAGEGSTARH